MKTRMRICQLLFLFCLSGIAYAAPAATADAFRKSCEPFRSNAKPSLDKAFCRGYLIGWRSGLEGAQVSDDKNVMQIVTFGSGVSDADMAKSFLTYMDNHPEEKDAMPKIALMHAMVSGGLVKLTPAQDQGK